MWSSGFRRAERVESVVAFFGCNFTVKDFFFAGSGADAVSGFFILRGFRIGRDGGVRGFDIFIFEFGGLSFRRALALISGCS